jgi:hypothetical protein
MDRVTIKFDPRNFCSRDVETTAVDPCSVKVETSGANWQVWKCNASCLRQKLAELPEAPGLFEPAHF